MSLRILTADEVKQALPMAAAIEAMRQAFTQLGAGQIEMPLRSATKNNKQNATTLCMPAYLEQSEQLGVKIVSIYPNNAQKNIPTINGVVMLFNALTGQVEALLEGASLTAIRTGAASGLATDLLANKDAHSVAIIGTGAQAQTQLEAVCCVREIKEIYIYSRNVENAQRFSKKLTQSAQIHVCSNVQDATRNADIICTVTPATTPIIDILDIKPGSHINAVGSHTPQMMELGGDLLSHAKIFVDERNAALAEAGEIISALKNKQIKSDALHELGAILNHKVTGRDSFDQITVFKSVGLAIQDVSAAGKAYTMAQAKNLGNTISF